MSIQGISKRWAPGCVKMRWKSCFILLAECKHNSTFSPNFTQPGKSLLEIPCILLISINFLQEKEGINSNLKKNFPDTRHLGCGGPPCKASHHPMKDWSFSALWQSDCALWRRGCEPQRGSAAHLSFHLLLWSMLWDTLFHGKEK